MYSDDIDYNDIDTDPQFYQCSDCAAKDETIKQLRETVKHLREVIRDRCSVIPPWKCEQENARLHEALKRAKSLLLPSGMAIEFIDDALKTEKGANND